jgi:hypothetical protein
MKSDMTNTILTFVLGVLVVTGVIFALQTIFLTRELRSLTMQATVAQSSLLQVQSLYNDASAYNQKAASPELTKILQAQTKPAQK